ncbi:MAG: hypothetical protein LUQ03_00275, partial [Methanomicrobiales archaeon]|nr:hypothetical protein [Methanomicrobiales archaeon]
MTLNRQRAGALGILLLLLLLAALPAAGTAREILITPDPANQEAPAIWEDRIVWQDNRHGNWDIYLLEMSSGTETRINKDTADQKYPAIWGNQIVATDYRQGSPDIFVYNT